MSSYIGRHAQLYDIFYAEKNYQQEANFIHQLIRQFGKKGKAKKMMELACGTGNHAFQLEQLGYEIQAIDYSADMIGKAKEKAIEKQSKINFQIGDMRELPLFEEKFDVAISLFDSIGYVITNEAITSVLQGISKNLFEGGLFIFEFWHAPAMLKSFDPVRIKRWKLSDREILRTSETSVDIPSSTSTVSYNIYEFFPDNTFAHLYEAQRNRFFQLQEMQFFVENAGFKVLNYFDGYDNGEILKAISEQTWHVVMVAQKV